MLDFVFGTPGFGGGEYMYDKIKEDILAEKNAFILVPEQYSLFAEKDMLDTLGVSSQRFVQVITFSRLTNMIFSASGPLRMKYIDSAGKNMLISKALDMCKDELVFLKKNINRSGFSSSLLSCFDEFKRYGITTEKLNEVSKDLKDHSLSQKLTELGEVYDKYNEILNERNSDSEDDLKLVASKISKCNFLSGRVYIRFFRSFTPVEYDVIFELMKIMDITFIYTSDGSENFNSIYQRAARTKKNLTEFAEKNNIETGKSLFLAENKTVVNEELNYLKDNFLSYSPKQYGKAVKNIHLVRANTVFDEIEAAAKHILKLSRTKGYKPEDFLVLLADGESYFDIVPVIFEKYNIKCYLDSGITLTSHPFVRFLMGVFEILSFGYSYERVIGLIKTGMFKIEKFEADIFENYILESGVLNRNFITEKALTINPENKYDLDLINSVKERSVDKVLEFEKSIKGRKTFGQILSKIYVWLDTSGIKEEFEKKLNTYSENNELDKKEEAESVWNAVNAIFEEAEEIFGNEYVTYKKFYEIFVSACDDVKLGVAPQFLNRVIFSEAKKFVNTDAKVVMVLGVKDGSFPQSFSQDGIISDEERLSLMEKGLILAPTALDKQYDEQLQVYSILTSPKDELFVFSHIMAEDGSAVLEGEVFSQIKNIFPEIKEERQEETEDLFLIEGKNSAFEMLWENLIECGGNKDNLSSFWKYVYEYFENEHVFSKKLRDIEKLSENEPELKLSIKKAEELYGKPLMLSVSKLEKYNGCAFSYFLTYGLFIKERKKASFESNDMGDVLHDVLCRYFSEKEAEKCDYSSLTYNEVKEEISRVVDESKEISESILFKTSSYHKMVLLKIKSVAEISAWKIVKFYATSTYRPYGFEIKIGKDGIFPAYNITLENTSAKIRGAIDRLDVSEIDGKKYFNIIDYKSSEKNIDKELAEKGVRFQPLLYAGIVEENIENSKASAMLYMQMNNPVVEFSEKPELSEYEKAVMKELKVEGLVLDDEAVCENLDCMYADKSASHFVPFSRSSMVSQPEMDTLIKGAIKTAQETAEKIADGKIEVNPLIIKKYNACEYCKFSGCCEING